MIAAEIEEKILRLHFVERWPVGTIATQCQVHRSTVQRVLHDKGVASPTAARPTMVEPFLDFIGETMAQYPKISASRLYVMVTERGYRGSESHFRRLVRLHRPRRPAEAFLRLKTLPGEEAQVDWAHFGHLHVGKAKRTLSAFVIVLSWSRKAYVEFFLDQRMSSFLHGHLNSFRHFGGVPRRILYDNLKSVVLERRGDIIRFNPTFLSFSGHYRYEPRPVAVARGNEKGRVERFIRYLRTSFWEGRTWRDLADLNAQVRAFCDGTADERLYRDGETISVREAFQNELPHLLPLPDDDAPAHERVEVTVGKQPYVRFETNDYSVPHDRVRRTLTLLATPTEVRIVDGDDVITTHRRSFSQREQIEDPKHVAALVEQKRAAREGRGIDALNARVPASVPWLQTVAERGHNVGTAVAGLLRLVERWGPEPVERALRGAIEAKAVHVGYIRHLLETSEVPQDGGPPRPVYLSRPTRERDVDISPHDLGGYDLGGEP
jgi:transposase